MKVGDSLYCYNNIIKRDFYEDVYEEIDFTIGTIYTIYNINDNFLSATLNAFEHLKVDSTYIWLIANNGDKTWCSILDTHLWYFGDYFYTLRELRKLKLDILGMSSLINTEVLE